MRGYLAEMISPDRMKAFVETQEADFSYSYGEKARFRGNAYVERGQVSVALRLIPRAIRTIAELNLPPSLESFTARD